MAETKYKTVGYAYKTKQGELLIKLNNGKKVIVHKKKHPKFGNYQVQLIVEEQKVEQLQLELQDEVEVEVETTQQEIVDEDEAFFNDPDHYNQNYLNS